MVKWLIQALFLAVSTLTAAIPTPREHLGYAPGADNKLADYDDISGYFKKLATSSPRMKLVEFGRSALGKPMYVAFISSEGNLKNLEEYRELNRKMALGEGTREEAEALSRKGKAIVWIDSGLHASEASTAQGAPELAFKMLTDESFEVQRIRQNVILMQIPCINPDGLDMISHWFRKNTGTPYEAALLPNLYQKYAGHDNNRDWFMFNLQETRAVGKLLFEEWFPHIVYNQHQAPAFPARIFTPPYAEPLNASIPSAVMEGINRIGMVMRERFALEGKTGVLSYLGYDGWWNGGLRSAPAFHNMHGILTEVAMQPYAIPKDYKLSALPDRFANGMPTKVPSIFYTPWLGGHWGTRDAIEYMLTADFAILNMAAVSPDSWLLKAWEMAQKNMDLGRSAKPFAWIIPPDQRDPWSTNEMLRRLQMGGIEVHRSTAAIAYGDKFYPANSYVLLASQPFRAYVYDLMEPQSYPEIRSSLTGPVKRPYDIAGWTLPMQMDVAVERVDDRFDTSKLQKLPPLPKSLPNLSHASDGSFIGIADLLSANQPVRWTRDGKIVTREASEFSGAAYELSTPRLALYEPAIAGIDLGWTEWTLDTFKIPYKLLRNSDIQAGNLNSRFDTILFSQQSAESILLGTRPTAAQGPQRPEQLGGIGTQGAAAIEAFVRAGGMLITLSTASELPMQLFPLDVRHPSAQGEPFFSPGSLVRATVDTANPIAFGMPGEAIVFSSAGPVLEPSGEAKSIVRYAKSNLLASGYISGEKAVLGRSILTEAPLGKGHVILFGFSPQHRGQTFGTFKLLLNAIYLGSAKKL